MDMEYNECEMTMWVCPSCGCPQSMPTILNEAIKKSGSYFYCVNGHRLYHDSPQRKESIEEMLFSSYVKNAQLESTINLLRKDMENKNSGLVQKALKKIKSFL